MKLYRVDFKVIADLVLPVDAQSLHISAGSHTFTFFNGEDMEDGHVTRLIVSVVGPCESLGESLEAFRTMLSDQLNWVTFVTQHRFEIEGPTIALEWAPGPSDREFKGLVSRDSRWPPAPQLSSEITHSAQCFSDANLPRHITSAVRSFRMGMLQATPEAQFQGFWTAFESIMAAGKDKRTEPASCHSCQSGLVCLACKTPSLMRPSPKPRMRKALVQWLGDDRGPRLLRALELARNRLFHGAPLLDTERELVKDHGITLAQCAEHAGRAAHRAIFEAAAPFMDDGEGLRMFEAEHLLSLNMQVAFGGVIPHGGPEDHPPLPKFEAKLLSGFSPDSAPS